MDGTFPILSVFLLNLDFCHFAVNFIVNFITSSCVLNMIGHDLGCVVL